MEAECSRRPSQAAIVCAADADEQNSEIIDVGLPTVRQTYVNEGAEPAYWAWPCKRPELKHEVPQVSTNACYDNIMNVDKPRYVETRKGEPAIWAWPSKRSADPTKQSKRSAEPAKQHPAKQQVPQVSEKNHVNFCGQNSDTVNQDELDSGAIHPRASMSAPYPPGEGGKPCRCGNCGTCMVQRVVKGASTVGKMRDGIPLAKPANPPKCNKPCCDGTRDGGSGQMKGTCDVNCCTCQLVKSVVRTAQKRRIKNTKKSNAGKLNTDDDGCCCCPEAKPAKKASIDTFSEATIKSVGVDVVQFINCCDCKKANNEEKGCCCCEDGKDRGASATSITSSELCPPQDEEDMYDDDDDDDGSGIVELTNCFEGSAATGGGGCGGGGGMRSSARKGKKAYFPCNDQFFEDQRGNFPYDDDDDPRFKNQVGPKEADCEAGECPQLDMFVQCADCNEVTQPGPNEVADCVMCGSANTHAINPSSSSRVIKRSYGAFDTPRQQSKQTLSSDASSGSQDKRRKSSHESKRENILGVQHKTHKRKHRRKGDHDPRKERKVSKHRSSKVRDVYVDKDNLRIPHMDMKALRCSSSKDKKSVFA